MMSTTARAVYIRIYTCKWRIIISMVVEGKKGVNQGFSIVKALLLTKTVSDKRDICAIMDRSSVYKGSRGS
jgi:hypothetical protein